ncbi:MAG: hypothetical protein LBS65_05540 [Desulfovibrio sp.]|jgi:hypothetical protein|nr:hypothetical protein [Desulfovibrio sp.]
MRIEARIEQNSFAPIANGEAVQADHDKLAALDAEAAELRAELAGLQGTVVARDLTGGGETAI